MFSRLIQYFRTCVVVRPRPTRILWKSSLYIKDRINATLTRYTYFRFSKQMIRRNDIISASTKYLSSNFLLLMLRRSLLSVLQLALVHLRIIPVILFLFFFLFVFFPPSYKVGYIIIIVIEI